MVFRSVQEDGSESLMYVISNIAPEIKPGAMLVGAVFTLHHVADRVLLDRPPQRGSTTQDRIVVAVPEEIQKRDSGGTWMRVQLPIVEVRNEEERNDGEPAVQL